LGFLISETSGIIFHLYEWHPSRLSTKSWEHNGCSSPSTSPLSLSRSHISTRHGARLLDFYPLIPPSCLSKAVTSGMANPVIATARDCVVRVEDEHVRGDPVPYQHLTISPRHHNPAAGGRLTEHQTARNSCAPPRCQLPLLPVSKHITRRPPTPLPAPTIPSEKRRAPLRRRIAQVLTLRRAVRVRRVRVSHPLFPIHALATPFLKKREGKEGAVSVHADQKPSAPCTTLRRPSIPPRWRPWAGRGCSW
jgi:hypothetical protein